MEKFGALKHFISTSGALLMSTLMSSEVRMDMMYADLISCEYR